MPARLLLLSVLAFLPPRSQEPSEVLTGVERTAHFEIRFRPGSRAEASVDRVAVVAEEDLVRILREVGLGAFPHTIRLFLYDDVAELQRVTGVGSAGHSSPLESHVPHDDDPTRVHELVHVVAEKFPEEGPEARSLFFAEGLSNAILRFVHGVPVEAVAAFHRRRGDLPSLREIHGIEDFYAWLGERPGFDGYDVAGSYLRHLLDTYGPAKVRAYVRGVPIQEAIGADLETIERAWHARLDRVRLRPGLETLLRERAGGATASERNSAEATLGEAALGPSSEWTPLAGSPIPAGDPGRWEEGREGESALFVTGEKSQGDWSVARVGDRLFADAMLRGRAHPLEGCFGVQIQLGVGCQAMLLRGQGAFLYNEIGGVAHDGRTQLGEGPVEIVLRRRGGRASVWIDGRLVGEADVAGTPAPLGVGSVGGGARFTDLSVRRLPE